MPTFLTSPSGPPTTHRRTRHRTERLAEVLREERRNEGAFQPLPFHYVEIVLLLLQGSVASLCVCICVYMCVRGRSEWSARALSFPSRPGLTPMHTPNDRAADEFTMPDRTRTLIEVSSYDGWKERRKEARGHAMS